MKCLLIVSFFLIGIFNSYDVQAAKKIYCKRLYTDSPAGDYGVYIEDISSICRKAYERVSKEVYDEIIRNRETNKLTKCEIELQKKIQKNLQPPDSKYNKGAKNNKEEITSNCKEDRKTKEERTNLQTELDQLLEEPKKETKKPTITIEPFEKPEF